MVYKDLLVFVTVLTLFVVTNANRRSVILPPEPAGPESPTCSSYSALCHLAYNISDFSLSTGPYRRGQGNYRVLHSQSQICRCPHGQTCETNWFSRRNSILKSLKNGGIEMEVKMSYCNLTQASRVCRQNEPALILMGRGIFVFEIVQDFTCRCYRRLYAHRSWRVGDYDYFEYSCGKPRCGSARFPTRHCTRITYQAPENYSHDYMCRCRRFEECTGTTVPTETSSQVYQTCQPLNFFQNEWNQASVFKRKRHAKRQDRKKHSKD